MLHLFSLFVNSFFSEETSRAGWILPLGFCSYEAPGFVRVSLCGVFVQALNYIRQVHTLATERGERHISSYSSPTGQRQRGKAAKKPEAMGHGLHGFSRIKQSSCRWKSEQALPSSLYKNFAAKTRFCMSVVQITTYSGIRFPEASPESRSGVFTSNQDLSRSDSRCQSIFVEAP